MGSIGTVSVRGFPGLVLACLLPLAASGQLPAFHVDTLGTGVYVVWDSDALATPVHGNTTFVVGDRDVLVVDASRTASAAEAGLAILRSLTDKPVSHLVNTHWHEDHVLGNAVYADAFQNLRVVAHIATDAAMRHEATAEFPSFVEGLAARLGQWEERLRSGRDPDGEPLSAAARLRAQTQYDMLAYLVPEDRSARWAFPDLTFTNEVRIDLGGREVHLLHLGRGNTAGDVVALLPSERILVAGDLVVFPVPYGSGSFPEEWIEVMRRLGQLEFDRIVPGHGHVLSDRNYLERVSALLTHVVGQARAGAADGSSVEEILGRLAETRLVSEFTEDDSVRRALLPFFLRPVVIRTLELSQR